MVWLLTDVSQETFTQDSVHHPSCLDDMARLGTKEYLRHLLECIQTFRLIRLSDHGNIIMLLRQSYKRTKNSLFA